MKKITLNNYQKTKYFSCCFFILIGLLNLIDALAYDRLFLFRDLTILLVLGLPLLINKRLFYLAYGFVAALVSFVILILYIATFWNSPIKPENSILFFLVGCVVISVGMACSLGLIYIGTFSQEKNRFKLI